MRLKRRTLLVLGPAIVFAGTLWWLARAPGKLVGDEVVQARVVAVELRGRGPDKAPHAPLLVTLELADGGRGRLWWPPPGPAVGAAVAVRVSRYDDGSRRLSLPAAAEGD